MHRIRCSLAILAILGTSAALGYPARDERPNYRQAEQFSPAYLRQRTYSTSVQPHWIGETDRFWYSYRTSAGVRYHLVDPAARTKDPLFDHERLASLLSVEVRKPLDAYNLALGNAEIDDEGATLSFVIEKTKFDLDLATGNLTNQGAAPEQQRNRQFRGQPQRGGQTQETTPDPRQHRNFSPDRTAYVFMQAHDLYYVEASEEIQAEIKAIDERMKKEKEAEAEAGEVEDAVEKEEVEKHEDVKQEDEQEEREEQQEEEQDDVQQEDKKEIEEQEQDEKQEVETQQEEQQDDEQQDDEQLGIEKQEDEEQDDEQKDEEEQEGEEQESEGAGEEEEDDKVDERERWADAVDEAQAIQLTDDGEEDYEFSSSNRRFRRGSEGSDTQLDDDEYLELLQAGAIFNLGDEFDYPRQDDDEDEEKDEDEDAEKEEEKKSRPGVRWAPDSTAFYAMRRDSRDVGELFLVNSLSQPRPTLETYSYPLPGESDITTSELHVFDRARGELFRIEAKWTDEDYQNIHWPKAVPPTPDDEDAEPPDVTGTGDELRMIRRDRLLRNIELCSLDVRTGENTVLIEEGFDGANISPKSVRYLRDRDEMLWWSERSGWGHYYLYSTDGELKNTVTSGPFRASSIIEVDEDKGLLYFTGNAREPGENIYYQHLYRVFLDGTGLTLMDPGESYHRSTLSPTQNYLVDNCSRIDMAPVSRLCNADGKEVMPLEETDLSRLYEAGWTMPETFVFKAADGVTNLYGNMWKPFDFDPEKAYPIIAEVYPGPQTEGVSHTFSASNGRQQLAQIGFIVVQLGHRGGTPGRSKSYHSYGYFNLRDYGLADKKAGIEQLAERHPFIDIERVGIYGHSGGGFMTAAALLREPYNDFFKVGVSSSGNHDNNVYGRSWAERYHGLREVQKTQEGEGRGRRGQRNAETAGQDEGDEQKEKEDNDEKKDDGEKNDDGDNKKEDQEKDNGEKQDEKQGDKEDETETETAFEINVPTNAELAANLKGHLLLVHGDMDNNVHPAGTMRLVDALMKANKRFDMLIIPGKRHGYGDYSSYFTQRKWEFFAEHLLGDHQTGADIIEKD